VLTFDRMAFNHMGR